MITLRKGKARTILENSRNSALNAVETYNRPNSQFRIENYIVLMVMAWTKLFHAYFQSTIGERYFYKKKNGRYELIDGEKKAWDLKECIKKYRKANPAVVISDAVIANLHFFIGLRNRIEHRYWNSDELDILLFGECQSLLFNYENLLIGLFGEDYSINASLAYALQFSHLRTREQVVSQKHLLSKDMQDIKRYIDKYKLDLSQDIYDSQEFSIKLLQIPKISNTKRSDLAIEFVNWNSLDDQDKANYEKVTTIIKDKLIVQNVSNVNLLKPSGVVEAVQTALRNGFNMAAHTALWKAFGVRPEPNAESEFETVEEYCVYDEPHGDYLYTSKWVDFIKNLYIKHGFTKDNLHERCSRDLKIDDYKN